MGRAAEPVAGLPSGRWAEWEPLLRRFDLAWRRGSRPTIEDYLPADAAARTAVLIELVHADLEYRIRGGEAARAEEYLERFPELRRDAEAERGLIAAERELLRRREPAGAPEDKPSHPPVARPAAVLAPDRRPCPRCRAPIVAAGGDGRPPVACPTCGAELRLDGAPDEPGSPPRPAYLGKYELLDEIGRGAFGVVYRARDLELDRIVAVKVPRPGRQESHDPTHRASPEAHGPAPPPRPPRVTPTDGPDLAALLAFETRYELRRPRRTDGPHASWFALDRLLGREVVVHVARRPEDTRGFLRSARTAAALRHPNIEPLYELGFTAGRLPYFTRPRVEGETLGTLLRRLEGGEAARAAPVPLEHLVGVVRDACRALSHARGLGYYHDDLDPDAILVGPGFGEVLVLDGWRRIKDADSDGDGGAISFRPAFVSPERVRHWETVPGPSSDVFTLGGILHVILYGTPPNHLPGEHTLAEWIRAIADGHFDAREPGRLRPGLEPRGRRSTGDLEQICLRALDGDPARRTADADALACSLDAWLEG